MCGTRLKNGWLLLVSLLLLALPGYLQAGGSAEESNAEPIERNPESLPEPLRQVLEEVSDDLETASIELTSSQNLIQSLKQELIELRELQKAYLDQIAGLKTQLTGTETDLTKSWEEIKRVNELLTRQKNDALSIGIPTGVVLLVAGGIIGGLIHSEIPVVK